MRKFLLHFTVILVGAVFLGRLSYLQLFDDSFEELSTNNAVKAVYDYPERGYIYDRNGKLLVANQPAYDVMVTPREVQTLDTLEFCQLLNIDKKEFIRRYRKAYTYSPWRPSVFIAQLAKEEYASLQEKMHKYQGFFIQKRSLRSYRTHSAGNVLGYISEVNDYEVQKNPYYQAGELIGRQGIEKSYEEVLRGVKGVKRLQKDRFNRIIGPYKNGIYDTLPQQGRDIYISLDIELQEYGELLMNNKRGGIVAVEPSSGELLALISAPTYDPSQLVGRQRSKNYAKLHRDTINRPLFDRGLQAQYPPGSPFKTLNALVALQEGVVTPDERITCYHGHYYAKGRWMGCHCPSGTKNNMDKAVYQSCNTYFSNVYRRVVEKYESPKEGIQNWNRHIESFGLGNFLGNDLPIGTRGTVPDSSYYKRMYPRGGWRAVTTISNAIGQGEILASPIQLANMTATIANRGYYYTPHIIRDIKGQSIDEKFTTKRQTTISADHFGPVIEGMFNVVEKKGGTARIAKIPGIEVCGKTGTAENFAIIDSVRTQLTDHSIFVAFAPKENPKIAIAVFIENGYWGSRWAAPIASLMIEKYLTQEVKRDVLEERMMLGSLQDEYDKPLSGEPFEINQ